MLRYAYAWQVLLIVYPDVRAINRTAAVASPNLRARRLLSRTIGFCSSPVGLENAWNRRGRHLVGAPCRIVRCLVPRLRPHIPHVASAITNADMSSPSQQPRHRTMPCFDRLDKKIFSLAVPDVVAFLIPSTVQASDLFWVGKLGEALAVASLSAVNQLYSTFNLLTSTIRTVTAPRVAKARATNDTAGVQEAIGESIFIACVLGILCSGVLWHILQPALGFLGNPNALPWAMSYAMGRLPGVIPSAVSLVGIAAFRGVMDTVTPLKITMVSNLVNVLLAPLLMFTASLGIVGCGLAASASSICAAATYLTLLFRRNLVRWGTIFKVPSQKALKRLTTSVGALQIRSLASQFATLTVTKTVQGLDETGIAAAAHAICIQRWIFGCVILGGFSTAASIIIPTEMSKKGADFYSARAAASRLLCWGFILGLVIAAIQLATLSLLDVLTPLHEVRRACVGPSIIAAGFQILNGLTFVGEGIMAGTQSFGVLALAQVIASLARLLYLHLAPATLPAVWCSLGVSQSVLVASVLLHHFVTGPLAKESSWAHRQRSTAPSSSSLDPSSDEGLHRYPDTATAQKLSNRSTASSSSPPSFSDEGVRTYPDKTRVQKLSDGSTVFKFSDGDSAQDGSKPELVQTLPSIISSPATVPTCLFAVFGLTCIVLLFRQGVRIYTRRKRHLA